MSSNQKAAKIVGVLSLLILIQKFVAAGVVDTISYQTSGTLLIAIHDWTFMLGPLFILGIHTII